MSNFDDFVMLMDGYLAQHGYPVEIRSDMHRASFNKEERKHLVESTIPIVDMDTFAQKAYRKIIWPDSVSEDDSINTADAFLINREKEWYLIEFKDAVLSKAKTGILRKAYSSVYALLDLLYDVRENNRESSLFDYGNPVRFFQTNVQYILVFRAAKNPEHVQQMKNYRLKNENYLPLFMKRVKGYIFKEAYAVTEEVFEHTFIKNFDY